MKKSHCNFIPVAKSPSLTMSAMSSTICAHHCVHSLKSAISLWWVVCAFQPGLASNRWGQNSVRPNHLFDPDRDHDYFFELPSVRGAGYPIITSVIYCKPRILHALREAPGKAMLHDQGAPKPHGISLHVLIGPTPRFGSERSEHENRALVAK